MNYPLSGSWQVRLDPENKGMAEQWYAAPLSEEFVTLPGTTASNHIGNEVMIEKTLHKEAVRCLRQEYQYIGACFYQREFTIEKKEQSYLLYLERVMFQSQVWIDEHFVGVLDSLSVAHRFDITAFVQSGVTHRLTLRIDNSDVQNVGPYPSAYTDETQTIWNGVVGKMMIIEQEPQYFEKLLCFADDEKNLVVKAVCANPFCTQQAKVTLTVADENGVAQTVTQSLELSQSFTVSTPLSSALTLWSEFSPKVYQLTVAVELAQGTVFSKTIQTGFRYLGNKDGVLTVNGVQTFLRGNIDCCIYPLTAYPPMCYAEWEKVFAITKNYGFNHIRFHSWCPPEEAFQVADDMGLYLQVEGPVWMDNWMEVPVGGHPDHYKYLPKEAERMIWEYSSHPSLCFFANGNELNGDFSLLETMTKAARAVNPSVLYTLTSNWDRPQSEEDDIFIAQSVESIGVRGQYFLDDMVDGSMLSFEEGVGKRNVPVISHEVGQYVVYPDIDEIPQYTGVLKPTNLEVIGKDLEQKGLRSYLRQFVKASGLLSKNLYKAEFEAALRTKNQGGIQILSLHDFPGQSTATIGLLNPFFESKGVVTPEEFREFCNEVVPLAKLEKFQFSTEEAFRARFAVANYSGKTLEGETLTIMALTDENECVYQHSEPLPAIALGVQDLSFAIDQAVFATLTGRNHLQLVVQVGKYTNHWDIWVYAPIANPAPKHLYRVCDDEMLGALERGETVFFCPDLNTIKEKGPSCYFPVFWSPVHFASKDNCGMLLDNTHPLFHTFYPEGDTGSYEWKTFLENTSSINIDALGSFEPLNMLVPNFYNNHKCSHILEAAVGKGKLFVCAFDFTNPVSARPEVAYLQQAIAQYLESDAFAPTQTLTPEQLKGLFIEGGLVAEEQEDIAAGKQSFADTQKANAFAAGKGNDNNPATCWVAGDGEKGHYWYVDLGKEYDVTGTKVIFNELATYLYVIQTSLDGENWDVAINKTGEVKKHKEQSDTFAKRARYVKITYSGLQPGIWAGHEKFSVYVENEQN